MTIKNYKPELPAESKNMRNMVHLEVTGVDATPQPLRKLRTYTGMVQNIPALVSTEAKIVLIELFQCFEKAGVVSEGLIGDIIWGFAQVSPPIPSALTIAGLRHLECSGYVRFQAKDGSYIDFSSDKIEGAFVRYQPKLLDLVYTKEGPND